MRRFVQDICGAAEPARPYAAPPCAARPPAPRIGAAARADPRHRLAVAGVGAGARRLAAERDVIALDLPGFGESLPLDGSPSVPELRALGRTFVAELRRRAPARGRQLARRRGRARARPHGGRRARSARSRPRASPRAGRCATRSRRCASRARWRGARAGGRRARRAAPRDCAAPLAPDARAPGAGAAGRGCAGASRNLGRSRGFRATLRAVATGASSTPARRSSRRRSPGASATGCCSTGRQSARARAALPAARHVTLTGCGHVPTWDDPEQVRRVLLDASR